MFMDIVTILTPTYNRKNLLIQLYNSLQKQIAKNFEWLIIDDGSTDGTYTIIDNLRKNANFNIEYKFKENGGKHTALNYAYQFISTPLTFIVDSDDKLTSDATLYIEKVYNKYKNEKDLCGFSFLRAKNNGECLSNYNIKKDGLKESYVECRINRGINGDMAEVWLTNCLREYPFPEIENEHFLGEDVVWIRMSEKYKMRFFNKVIYISDYLQDGLTNNRRKYNILSPNGCIIRAEVFLNSNANFKAKLKAMLQYYIYGRFAGKSFKELFQNSRYKMLLLMLVLPAHFIYINWKNKF